MDGRVDQRGSDAALTRGRRLLATGNLRRRLLRQTKHNRLCEKPRDVRATVGESDRHRTDRRDIYSVLRAVVLGAQERQTGRIAGMYSRLAVIF